MTRQIPSMIRFLLLAASLAVAACGDNPAAPPATNAPDQILYGVRHTIIADGLIRSRIEADSAFLYLAQGSADLYGLRAVLLDATLRQVASVTAPAGRIDFERPVLLARGGAEVSVEIAPRSLEAEEIEVDLERGRITVAGPVNLTDAGTPTALNGFHGTLDLRVTEPR